jgi:hypothetical protein
MLFTRKLTTDSFVDTEISSPKCNFNETFQIQNETTKSDMSFPLEDNIKEQDVQPDSLNDSSERKRITASPLRMQGQSKTSTPKGKLCLTNRYMLLVKVNK